MKWKSLKTVRLGLVLLLFIVLPILILGFDSVRQLFTRAQGTPANIIVDAQIKLEPIKPAWNAFSQGGEESGTDMIAPIVSETRRLNPQYIRLDHIYDHYDVVGRDSNNQLTFNFTRLDATVRSIIATGALPFFALSYMPPTLTSTGNITDKPRDWNEWALVVQRTVEHYSGRGGLNLNNVYYEVWNEPDLFGGWKYYGDKNYLTLYGNAVRGATRAGNVLPFKIGGPATTRLYKNWITALSNYVTNNNMRLDFFSWHSYYNDPKQFTTDISNVTTWLFPFPHLVALPRIVSEWGFDSNIHPGYDGYFSAVHALATIKEALFGYEYLMAFELVDGPSPENKEYWGRWGLITHPKYGKHIKPRHLAFQMMNTITGTRLLLRGEGTWVTGVATIEDKTIRTLLINYDYSGRHSETFPLTITGLTPGIYTISQKYLGKNQTQETINIDLGTYEREVIMPVNSAVLFEITPQETQ